MDDEELIKFAQAFGQLAGEAFKLVKAPSTIPDMVADHLGVSASELPAIVDALPAVERPNLQLALDALIAKNPESRLVGLSAELRHFGGFSIGALLAGTFRGPAEPVPPSYDELPIDVDRSLRCVTAGLWFVWLDDQPAVIGSFAADRHGPGDPEQRVEVVAATAAHGEAVVAELRRLRHELNVYRKRVLAFTFSQYGEFGIDFLPRPGTTASEVILPAADLASIERHTIGVADQAEALRARGQHLKRGLLLYGPPGTGKTHTISYLMAAMPERTVVVLQGASVGALGQAAAIARAFPPSMLVIEDVDLIASERAMPGMANSNPLMFQLLNEMDGLAPTDDVLFVLTTNRLDMLEPALAARPGRIDHAVEIARPDEHGRAQLLRLYLGDAADQLGELPAVVERTEGVTASFFKELVRRATLLAIDEADSDLTEAHIDIALAELLDHAAPVMRAMLGLDTGDEIGVDRGSRPPMMPPPDWQ